MYLFKKRIRITLEECTLSSKSVLCTREQDLLAASRTARATTPERKEKASSKYLYIIWPTTKLLFILPTKQNATNSRKITAIGFPPAPVHNPRVCFAVGRFSFQDEKFYMKETRKMWQRGA